MSSPDLAATVVALDGQHLTVVLDDGTRRTLPAGLVTEAGLGVLRPGQRLQLAGHDDEVTGLRIGGAPLVVHQG